MACAHCLGDADTEEVEEGDAHDVPAEGDLDLAAGSEATRRRLLVPGASGEERSDGLKIFP